MGSEERKVILLDTDEKLKIFSFPLRQRILRTMKVAGVPLTSKRVADMLGISPSSARHHLMKLQGLGLVEHDHYEMINGIQADYLRTVDASVSIGVQVDDSLYNQREQTTRQVVADIIHRFFAALPRLRNVKKHDPSLFNGDLLTGIVHLSEPDAKKFNYMVRDFLDAHESPASDKDKAWEFAFLMYETKE